MESKPITLPANNERTAHHPQGDQLGEFETHELFPQASYPESARPTCTV